MFYVFESIDKYGSRKRVIYTRLKNVVQYAWSHKKLPKIQRDANIK